MPILDGDKLSAVSAPEPRAPEADRRAASPSDTDIAGTGYAGDAIVTQVPALKRYALALTKSTDLAEELVQDCVTRALSRRHLFRDGMAMRPWLFTILHNLHVNNRRQAIMRSALSTDQATAATEQVAPNQERMAELREVVGAFAELPPDQQRVLLLVAVRELSYREAAETLGIPIGTVMSRLARGRERMRELLDPKRCAAEKATSSAR